MTKWLLVAAVASVSVGGIAWAQQSAAHHKILTPPQMTWAAGPPSLPPGARVMVLYGDPAKEGLFVMRLRLPAGYRIAPHTHPRPEIVTVVSGVFHLGTGENPVTGTTRGLPAGSFFALEPGTVHFARTRQPTVVQISSTGPWAITYVNAADDPRKK